ncbi:MAG TPA: hypothetical protein VIL41_00190 [Coriobacteriia bacterium]
MARRWLLLVFAVAAGVALAAPQSALAWGSGGGNAKGSGTHQWILRTANRFARQDGANWVDMAVATSATIEPDLDPADKPNHDYDRWGMWYGSANTRIATLYAQAVESYRDGDRETASHALGLLAQYYADVCDPLHTDESPAEPRMARRFERNVDWLLANPANSNWAAYDGYQRITQPAAATVSIAAKAHGSYSSLVSEYSAQGFDSKVRSIAKTGVGRAANGIADMIMSIQQAAIEVTTSPNVSAHQGVASGGGFYYVFHTTRITRYDQSWNATGTIDHPVGWWNGFIEPHLGDGCYYDGKLFVVAENYPDISNQQIMVFDATTLRYIKRFWTYQHHEVSSVTVADLGDGPVLVVSSFLDSTRLFTYRIEDGAYLGSLALQPSPHIGIQSVAFGDGLLYLCAGRSSGTGYLYAATPSGQTRLLYTRRSLGAHEGLDFYDGRLLWLVDRGVSGSLVYYLELPNFLYSLP